MPLFKCSASKAKPKNGIGYITDLKKAAIVSVKNLFDDEDYAKQFEETAKRFGKGEKYDERKYYHFKLSCARKDNVTPEKAHAYAEEIAEAFFKNYECVIATHTDTQTVHSHIIVNAVDPITGKKLQFSQKDYAKMKDEVNVIGRKYGFTETKFRKRGKNSRTAAEKKIILKGGTSWKEELREVIVEAVKKTKSPEAFKDYLNKCYGVKITRDGKDYSYLHPENVRGAKLGENYTKTEVIKRIGEQNYRQKSGAYTGRKSGFDGKSVGNRTMRRGKTVDGGNAGSVIRASLSGIEREMQRLNFAAECAGWPNENKFESAPKPPFLPFSANSRSMYGIHLRSPLPKIIKNGGSEVASEFNGKKTIKTRQSSEVVQEVLQARITQYLAGFLPLNLV